MASDMPTTQQFHARVLVDTFPQCLTDADAFLVFAILHSYIIVLAQPILRDAPNLQQIYALTQHGAADALAALWHGTADERADSTYWYWQWNTVWDAYRHLERLSDQEKARMRILKETIETHPFVAQLVPEDDDPLA